MASSLIRTKHEAEGSRASDRAFSCDRRGLDGGLEWLWQHERNVVRLQPGIECPTCHGSLVTRFSGAEKAASIAGLGLLSQKRGKTFQCINCGYRW